MATLAKCFMTSNAVCFQVEDDLMELQPYIVNFIEQLLDIDTGGNEGIKVKACDSAHAN